MATCVSARVEAYEDQLAPAQCLLRDKGLPRLYAYGSRPVLLTSCFIKLSDTVQKGFVKV